MLWLADSFNKIEYSFKNAKRDLDTYVHNIYEFSWQNFSNLIELNSLPDYHKVRVAKVLGGEKCGFQWTDDWLIFLNKVPAK